MALPQAWDAIYNGDSFKETITKLKTAILTEGWISG
jgi:hypothetical protein